MNKNVVVVRLHSGELLIGQVEQETVDASKDTVFKAPLFIAATQQGLGFAPAVPWAMPPKEPELTVHAGTIAMTIRTQDCEELIDVYRRTFSRIMRAPAGSGSGSIAMPN